MSNPALTRTRLAFLLLGVGGVVLSGAQVALFGSETEGLQRWGWLALAVLVVAWVDLYRSGRARWWRDVGVGASLHVFGSSLLFPTMGLVLYLFAILLHVLYGTRRDAGRAVALIVAGYLTAEVRYGRWESGMVAFVPLQVVLFVLMGVVVRAFYEALVDRERLSAEVDRLARWESITRLTGGVAHEFNNLLTAITNSVELAITELSADHPAREDLLLARGAAERAGVQTQQLLSFSQTAIVRPRIVEVRSFLADMRPRLERITGAAADLTIQSSSRPCPVYIDPVVFEQVVTHLVTNAAEAGSAEREPVRIRLRTGIVTGDQVDLGPPARSSDGPRGAPAATEEFVEISVSDSGRGMEPDVLEKVFEPFFTTKEMGSGLGLAMVHGAVNQAGGSVEVRSVPGEGTEVRLFLPLTPEDPAS